MEHIKEQVKTEKKKKKCSDLQYDILTMSVTVSMHIPRSE